MTLTDLDRYRETYKKSRDTLVLGDLQRHVMRESTKPDTERRDDVIHPSEMAHGSWCQRATFYRLAGHEQERPPIQFRSALIFAEGHEIHARYQRWLHEMGLLWGDYLCADCEHVTYRTFGRECRKCKGTNLLYVELALEDAYRMIAGSTDGVVVLPDGGPRLLEVKSIGLGTIRIEHPTLWKAFDDGDIDLNQLWFRLNRPLPSHLRQGMLYLALVNTTPDLVDVIGPIEEIIYIYEFKPTQETKEFVVRYNPALAEGRLEMAREIAVNLRSERPVLPDRPLWADSSTHPKCKECWFRTECWGEVSNVASTPRTLPVRSTSPARRRKALGR